MYVWARSSSWGRIAVLLLLAFAFQGTRGLWEPDEGFYANAALGMIDSGDYLVPRLNGAPFLDKPPLIYWLQAAGVRLLGRSEWGLRLGHALPLEARAPRGQFAKRGSRGGAHSAARSSASTSAAVTGAGTLAIM